MTTQRWIDSFFVTFLSIAVIALSFLYTNKIVENRVMGKKIELMERLLKDQGITVKECK